MITKPNLLLVVLLFMGTLSASCRKDDFRYQSDFENSFQKWLDFKEASGNSYRYRGSGGSWVGTGWETIITVSKGKVVQRYYKLSFPAGWTGTIPGNDETEWTENESEINSHEHTAAAEALTLDQVYEEARNNWLKKRSNAETYFESKNNGIISSCGYVNDGCQDDCFNGITITLVEAL